MDVVPDAKPRNLTADYDFDMGSGVGGDNAAPRGGNGATLHWTADGRSLIDVVAKQGRSFLVHVDAQSGAVSEITHGDQAVPDFTVSPDGHKIVTLISTPVMIGDLFVIGDDGRQRITDVNQSLWSRLNLTVPEEINYTSFDGKKIQGWIQKPPDFVSQKKYPLILDLFTAARMAAMDGSLIMNFSGWRRRVMSCSTSIRADRPATGRNSETSFSITIRGTTIAI